MVLERFIAHLPDALRDDPATRQRIVDAFDGALPADPPVVTVQRVDTRSHGSTSTVWEVVDRRQPKGRKIIGTHPTEQAARAQQRKAAPVSGGAYTLAAVDTDEPFHDTDYELLGNQHTYGVLSGCVLTESLTDMTVDLADGAILHNGSPIVVAAATDAYTLVSDGSNERWTAACLDSTGAAVLVSGDPATNGSTEPSKPEIGDRVLLKFYKIQAGQTVAADCEYKLDKRVITHGGLENAVQKFVEGGAYKGFFALGAPQPYVAFANNDLVGLGFAAKESATSGAVLAASSTGDEGTWQFQSGTTSGESAGVVGPYADPQNDVTLVWRGKIPSAVSQVAFVGFKTSADFTDENGIIAFRVSGTGNVFGVCDSGGTETTRDTGATGATEMTLRIEIRSGGSLVRFFKNNAQVGADVTTNIPTGLLITDVGILNSTTANKTMYTADCFGWREV